MSQRAVRAVQRWYPQIYFACHTRHQRAASSETRLSAHDSAILAHLDEERPIAASALARHLGIGAPTLSATLTRLATLGYITRTPSAADRRIADLRLSKTGARAMASSSVLEATRVATVLRELSAPEQRLALEGLALLARASRAVTRRQMRKRSTTSKRASQRRRVEPFSESGESHERRSRVGAELRASPRRADVRVEQAAGPAGRRGRTRETGSPTSSPRPAKRGEG